MSQKNSKPSNKRRRRRKPRSTVRRPELSPEMLEARNYMPAPPPIREYPPCAVSGEEIDNIVTAIAHPDSGMPCKFEKVLESLSRQHEQELSENRKLIYMGAGNFGILEERVENNRKVLEIVEKIPYEDTHQRNQWRKELSPGISRDYIPEPEPLDNLYTHDEIMSFPKLGAASGVFMPRTG